MQITHTILMVRPDHFGFNPQTAQTNVFQHTSSLSEKEIQKKALHEFSHMVDVLQSKGITVLVLPSVTHAITPDAVFPNNWFTTHNDGTLVIYPMLTANRREERQLEKLLQTHHHAIKNVIDLSSFEHSGQTLEGTGSLILDRDKRIAFCMISSRADNKLLTLWAERMKYTPIAFHGYDHNKFPIYHTNIAMSIGKEFVVICYESITKQSEKTKVENAINTLKKEVIPITMKQLFAYCGNILQVAGKDDKQYIVMSETAYNAFTPIQRQTLAKYGELLAIPLITIETVGGGSARCMMAEIFF